MQFSAIKPINRDRGICLIAHSGARTCSLACHNAWIRNNPERKRKIGDAFRGEKHPNWQGGKSILNNLSNRGPNWGRQRERAISRDKACVDCGITRDQCRDKYGRDLDVDHVVPYHNFASYRLANALGNLACRCASCHRIAEAKRRMVQMVLPMQEGSRRHRGYVTGERVNTAKLTAAAVMDIRRRVMEGESFTKLAREAGVRIGTISMAASGRTWRHLPMPARRSGT